MNIMVFRGGAGQEVSNENFYITPIIIYLFMHDICVENLNKTIKIFYISEPFAMSD